MRVITGTARGHRLVTLEGDDVRPTTDRVKEALFSMIQFQVEGRKVLDLFAGSGQLGIEALSRGCASCVFVDVSCTSTGIIIKNLGETRLMDRAQVLTMDALAYLSRCTERFDIALLDPPYTKGHLEKALPLLAGRMNRGGTILCESAEAETLPEDIGDFVKAKTRRYGKSTLTIYSHREVITGES